MIERLLRLTARNGASPIEWRVWSPVPGGSTLITSAPMSPRIWPQNGPAITWQSSTTRRRRRTRGGARVAFSIASRMLMPLQRRADPVADVVAGQLQAHLHAGQRARERQVVEVAEVADPEHLVLELAQSGAERHVEALEDHPADLVGAVARSRRSARRRTRARRARAPRGPSRARRRESPRRGGCGGRRRRPALPRAAGSAALRAARRAGWWRCVYGQ